MLKETLQPKQSKATEKGSDICWDPMEVAFVLYTYNLMGKFKTRLVGGDAYGVYVRGGKKIQYTYVDNYIYIYNKLAAKLIYTIQLIRHIRELAPMMARSASIRGTYVLMLNVSRVHGTVMFVGVAI